MMLVKGLLLLCFSLGLVAATDLKSMTEKTPYYCLDTDICNRGSNWQWCDEDGEERCRDCSEMENFCGKVGMPENCTMHCLEKELQKEKVKGCPPLDEIMHGHHNGTSTGTMHGDAIELHCKAGYHCQGQCITTCGDYGQYTHLLSCIENQCPALPFPKDGKYSPEKSTYDVKNMVNFTCKHGFMLDGSQSATCTKNGTWSIKRYPACIPNQEGTKIEHIIIAGCIGIVIGMIVGCSICWKFHPKRKVKDKKDKTGTNTDKQDGDEETELLSKECTGEQITLAIRDEKAQYDKPPHSHSDFDLSRRPVTSGIEFGRQNSVSENNIPSRAGQGTDSGISTSNPSKDSGLHKIGESSKGKHIQVNVNVTNCINNTNTNQQNNTMPERSVQSKDEDSKPAENMPKTPVTVKYPTEETRNGKDECRGELQDGTHVEEAGGRQGGQTAAKQHVEEKDRDHVPEVRPGFSVPEQQKFPPDIQFHDQPDDDDTGAKPGKVAIGSRSIDQGDINGHRS